ncbi:MAG: sugar transferase [Actinomycetota bacterium]
MIKRVFDVAAAGLGLLLLSPVLAIVALVVRFRIGRPVLFRQQRSGLGGEPFDILKFRSMLDTRGPDAELLPDDQRQSTIGSMLRKYSLDEFPALLNVLRGEMSVVGPRPFIHDYWELYTPEQARRCEVRPGITGWAQINGRNELTWEQKFDLDVWYVDHRSLWLDVKILAATIGKVLRGEGISSAGTTTAPRFTGTPVDES